MGSQAFKANVMAPCPPLSRGIEGKTWLSVVEVYGPWAMGSEVRAHGKSGLHRAGPSPRSLFWALIAEDQTQLFSSVGQVLKHSSPSNFRDDLNERDGDIEGEDGQAVKGGQA